MPSASRQPNPEIRDCRSLIVAVLRGEHAMWPVQWNRARQELFVRATVDHGVTALVRRHAMESGAWDTWPESVSEGLSAQVRQQAALEPLRRRELTTVLTAFADSGIECLLLKGTPLAYTVYESPAERPRGDTDILVPATRRETVELMLKRLGYTKAHMVSGDVVMNQFVMHKSDRLGIRHTLDVHWKLTNPQVFADTLGFEELWGRRIPVPALAPGAWTLSPVDALLYACVHRVAHHIDADRLIWLYDIHRLLDGRSDDEWRQIIDRAAEKRIAAVCLAGFAATVADFGTRLPDGLAERLAARTDRDAEAPSRAFLEPGRRRAQYLWSDLMQLDWKGRLKLLRETALPSPEYMLRHYGVTNRALLVWLYPYRMLGGAYRALRRPAGHASGVDQIE